MMQQGSLWAHTARERARHLPLTEDVQADVAVIGGGILGLSTALALLDAGRSVVVLEAGEIGAGASGRNGGLVVPSLPRVGPDDVLRSMGEERGASFIRLVLGAPAEVAGLIARHSIDCGFTQNGWLNPAHGPAMVAGIERRLAAWQRLGSPATLLSRSETQERIGSACYHGAIADPTGGHLNPLAYTRGLARAVASGGVRVHEQSRVRSARRRGDRWHLFTATGSVLAGCVVQATNAQPPGVDGDRPTSHSTVPLTVYELATPVLPDAVRARILPHDEAMSDTRNNLFACCIDDSGRIVTGGMAPLTQLGAARWLPPMLARRLTRLFPQLGEVRFEYVWSGRASLTPDFLPRLFQPAPEWFVPFTCNGRGVALSTATGARMGKWLATGDADILPLVPVGAAPVPLHAIASRIPQWLLPLGMIADWRSERDAG